MYIYILREISRFSESIYGDTCSLKKTNKSLLSNKFTAVIQTCRKVRR